MQQNRQIWDVKKLLDWSEEYFKKKDISQPRLSAELLLCAVLKVSRMQLYLDFARNVKENELSVFKGYILKRLEHTPIQYILNEAFFRNIKLYVDENVLVPRPETELLVDKTLISVKDILSSSYSKDTNGGRRANINIMEIGTGSGAIAISLAQEIDDFIGKNLNCGIYGKDINWKIIATECNAKALEIARENACQILQKEKYKKIEFINADIIPINNRDFNSTYKGKINILISNPPYIAKKDYESLPDEVRLFEPQGALLAGETGLEVYEKILGMSFPFLDSTESIILFETDPKISSCLKKIVGSYSIKNGFKSCDIEIENDYNNRERIISARLPGKI